MKRIEFRLSMPSTGSWDGRWSGEGRNYVIVRTMSDVEADKLLDGLAHRSWYHSWRDGWAALVTARVMDRGERARKSDGFGGYDWMVANILWYGSTTEPGVTA
jgi:hypothetical protein